MQLKRDDLLKMYRGLLLIRRFEEEAFRLALEGKYSNYHAGLGQEAVPVGACYGLTKQDKTMITHRGLGVLLMRGISARSVMSGLYANGASPTRGRIPIYHLAEPDLGILAGTTMVGSVIPLAVGGALSAKLKKSKEVVISFFGDGAVNRGDFHEGINLAAIWKLPIVFVCENNFYAKSMSIHESTAGADIAGRSRSYDIPGHKIDGNNVLDVYETMQVAIKRAREGLGPSLVEAQTYRWTPHSTAGDREFSRTKEELELWKSKDPVARLAKVILEKNHASDRVLNEMDETIKSEVQDAIQFAESAPPPPLEAAFDNVYR
jgi:acetoin:2,6-dichlorophenolindophenol oxidoreductase subunit alpha